MANDYKSQAISNQLADLFKQRLNGSLALVQSNDTDLNPLISIGPGTNGGANAIVKVIPQNWPLAQDVLGLSANIYGPHTVQLVTEADPAGGAGADPLTPAQLLLVIGQIVLMGCLVEWYQSASGTAPSAAAIIAGNLKGTFVPDVQYQMISSQ
jgi:hypothetical protein